MFFSGTEVATSLTVSKTVLLSSSVSEKFCEYRSIFTLYPNSILPSYDSTPLRILAKVDLPVPFFPTSAIFSPLNIVKLTFVNIFFLPSYDLLRLDNSMTFFPQG
jgi:hypothetical protein